MSQENSKSDFVLVVHGGAGTILKTELPAEKEIAYKEKLSEALMVGYGILDKSGSAVEAVEAAIVILENSSLFNAGKGSVFTNGGTNEMDASIMDGANLNAGAVAGVTTIKNPIKAARAVMEKSPHVMLIGSGAESFAKEQNLEIVDPSYFFDDYRYKQFQKIKDMEKQQLDHSEDKVEIIQQKTEEKYGTVGAVALDKNGNVAAATSTGGMTNKRYGRIGDSPIIGAGTYANNKTCAVSATGHGEYFMKTLAAYDVSAQMEYSKLSVQEASENVLKKITGMGGEGGLIALDKNGNFTMPFSTLAMIRGYVLEGQKPVVTIFR